jgi:fatty-acyl-CoA synthase
MDIAAVDTLGAALARQARRHPAARTVFPRDGEVLTLSELDAAADSCATALLAHDVRRGDVVALLLPGCADLLVNLFGVLRTGAAVSVLPAPVGSTGGEANARRLARVVTTAGIRVLVAHEIYRDLGRELSALVQELRVVSPSPGRSPAALLPQVEPGDPAVVQFTSGSTGNPRGVTLSHRAVLAGLRAIIAGSGMRTDDVLVQWVPQYHDMGLFGLLSNMLNGATSHVLEPFAFLRRPAEFLRYLAEHRGTLVTGPNFGYDLMLDAATPDLVGGLDLSSWRLAYNGAEPVSAVTVRRFQEVFAPAGVAQSVMYPVYGMAETTLAIAFPEPGARPRTVHVDRHTLAVGSVAERVPPGHPRAKPLVSVGRPVTGILLRLADEHDRPVAPGAVGEIQVRGDAIMSGYLGDLAATRSAFAGPWLRTGDLATELGGELFVVGRRKEMAIVHGRNFFPDDVESVAREVPGVYRRRCVAVPVQDPTGTEYLELIVESAPSPDAGLALAEEIRRRVAAQLDLHAVRIHVVRPRWLTRTTSGKWQRLLAARRLADLPRPSIPVSG